MFTPRTKRLDRAYAVVKQLCVPTKLRPDVAMALHDSNAHIGAERLYATCRSRYFWPGMYTFLYDHVRTCVKCQMIKKPTHPIKVPVGELPVLPPCSAWVADVHGPFPTTPDKKKYVVAFICSASQWVELFAVADATAETIVQCMFDGIISRYGVPRQMSIQSDNGSGFIAKLTSLFCKTFRIKQSFSSPYHPEPQSKVEAVARTIHNSLKALCTKQEDWSKHLQAVAMSYRGSATSSVGLSPHEIVFGRPFHMAIDYSLATPEVMSTNPQTYATEVKTKLDVLSYLAIQNSKESAANQRERKNTDAQLPKYQVGDRL